MYHTISGFDNRFGFFVGGARHARRRRLESWQWGRAFKRLLENKGVKRGSGKGDPRAKERKAETVSALASGLGVDDRTARNRMAAADEFDALPKAVRVEVAAQEKPLVVAVREQKRERAKAEHDALAEVDPPDGAYSVIVIDLLTLGTAWLPHTPWWDYQRKLLL